MRIEGSVHAVLVGIGGYRDSDRLPDLVGSPSDVLQFVEFLESVQTDRLSIDVCVSGASADVLQQLHAKSVVTVRGADSGSVLDAIHATADATNLLVYWSGHGGWDKNDSDARFMFCADSSADRHIALRLDQILKYLRPSMSQDGARRLLLVDACANPWAADEIEFRPVNNARNPGLHVPPGMVAAERGQIARQKGGSGVFTAATLSALRQYDADACWPLVDLAQRVQRTVLERHPTLPQNFVEIGDWNRDTDRFDFHAFDTYDSFEPPDPLEQVLSDVAQGRCIPIVGSHIGAQIKISARDVAQQLAIDKGYPFPDKHILAQVAEFVERLDDEAVHDVIKARYKGIAGKRAVRQKLESDTEDTRFLEWLVRLDVPIFITTAVDSILEHALKAAGKKPIAVPAVDFDEYQSPIRKPPTVLEPVVFHVYGLAKRPDTLKVTETSVLKRNREIAGHAKVTNILPSQVTDALSNTHLYCGFDLSDRSLRGLARAMKENGTAEERSQGALVVSPTLGACEDEDKARAFVTEYLRSFIPCKNVFVSWTDEMAEAMAHHGAD